MMMKMMIAVMTMILIIAKAPDFTTATACRSAVTGVGATLALGSHP